MAKVGFSGDKVYISNIYANTSSCVVGTRQGNIVNFHSGQYLGANSHYKSHLYFMGVTPCTVYDPVYEETYADGTIKNYCCPLKLKMVKTSYPKPCKIGLRAYSFKK